MAANPPYEGAEFVPGTVDEVGLKLLEAAGDEPQVVVAYAGYGFWAPASVVKAAGLSTETKELTNAPIAPVTAPYIDEADYPAIEVDEHGQPVRADGAEEPVVEDEPAPKKPAAKKS